MGEELSVIEIEKENEELKKTLKELAKNEYEKGFHIIDQPFIPEYIGFSYTEHRDEEDLIAGRIYAKDGFNIARKIDAPEWVILTPERKTFELLIESMFAAITILGACGMDISIQDYYDHNNQLMELTEKKMELGDAIHENELKHLEKSAEASREE